MMIISDFPWNGVARNGGDGNGVKIFRAFTRMNKIFPHIFVLLNLIFLAYNTLRHAKFAFSLLPYLLVLLNNFCTPSRAREIQHEHRGKWENLSPKQSR